MSSEKTFLPLRSLLEQAIEDINDYDYDGAIRLIKTALQQTSQSEEDTCDLVTGGERCGVRESLHDDSMHPFTVCQPRTKQALDPMMIVHGNGEELTTHPVDKPCGKCRPPFEVTDEMVRRALKAWDETVPDIHPEPYRNAIRAALEAALNAE